MYDECNRDLLIVH